MKTYKQIVDEAPDENIIKLFEDMGIDVSKSRKVLAGEKPVEPDVYPK